MDIGIYVEIQKYSVKKRSRHSRVGGNPSPELEFFEQGSLDLLG